MKKEKSKKKSLHTLDYYVIYCLAFVSLYTIAHTIIFAITGKEAKILDALVFAGFFGEIVQCYFIKKFKLHEEAKIVFGKKSKNEGLLDSDVDEPFTDE